jgi:uncharacterized iron-regulated membrane protein
MTPRRALFWLHLAAGSVAGIVILIMSVTGVLLAYERQITNWANRDYRSRPGVAGQARLSMDDLLEKVGASALMAPSAVVVRSDPAAPVQLSFGRERTLFVNAYSGAVLGEAAPGLHAFFSKVEDVHRYLGTSAGGRPAGRAVTGACNLAFLLLVASGPLLWWPKDWDWKNLRKIILFGGDLSGRARDWNWHNVIGVWCFMPLLLVVLSGVVMSYPWANNLLYRMTGNEPPPPPNQAVGRPGREANPGRPQRLEPGDGAAKPVLEPAFARAEQQVSGWQSVTLRLSSSGDAPLVFAIDTSHGGRPDKRAQLTLDPESGQVLRWEQFSSYNLGRRLRTWGRFMHTGEAGGVFGQTIAATASAGAAVLVWTGLALALRRCNRWRKRFRPQVVERG